MSISCIYICPLAVCAHTRIFAKFVHYFYKIFFFSLLLILFYFGRFSKCETSEPGHKNNEKKKRKEERMIRVRFYFYYYYNYIIIFLLIYVYMTSRLFYFGSKINFHRLLHTKSSQTSNVERI